VTPAAFRRLVLALPEALEQEHMGHPDFRVGTRIFATLGSPDGDHAMIRLPPEDQRFLLRSAGPAFRPAAGAWGRQGCTLVRLADAPTGIVRGAVRIAYDAAVAASARPGSRSARPHRQRKKR
jgi:hypothetical protein